MFACIYAPGNLPVLLDCARHFSPLIEATSNNTVVFDISGLGTLYGPLTGIAREIERLVGIPANIAIASNPEAAVHAAQGIIGTTVIRKGREAEALAPLALNLLIGSPEIAELLELWGIRTFGEFAKLPPLGIAARLGDEGLYLHRLARGEGYRRLRLINEPLRFEEEMELENPVESLEPLSFLLAQLLGNICRQLSEQSLATNEIRLCLMLENSPDHIATLRFPVPMLHKQSFLKMLQLNLNERPPLAPILKLHVSAQPVKPRFTQHGLYVPASPEPEKIELTITRIEHIVGAGKVGTPELLDTHRPDAFVMRPFAVPVNSIKSPLQSFSPPRLSLRRFRPVHDACVMVADRQPIQIAATDVKGKVIRAEGPWRIAGNWWASDFWNRDEWDVALYSGGLYRIFQNLENQRWFVEGSYD